MSVLCSSLCYKAVYRMMHVIIPSLFDCVSMTHYAYRTVKFILSCYLQSESDTQKKILKRQIVCGVIVLKMKNAYFMFIKTKQIKFVITSSLQQSLHTGCLLVWSDGCGIHLFSCCHLWFSFKHQDAINTSTRGVFISTEHFHWGIAGRSPFKSGASVLTCLLTLSNVHLLLLGCLALPSLAPRRRVPIKKKINKTFNSQEPLHLKRAWS